MFATLREQVTRSVTFTACSRFRRHFLGRGVYWLQHLSAHIIVRVRAVFSKDKYTFRNEPGTLPGSRNRDDLCNRRNDHETVTVLGSGRTVPGRAGLRSNGATWGGGARRRAWGGSRRNGWRGRRKVDGGEGWRRHRRDPGRHRPGNRTACQLPDHG